MQENKYAMQGTSMGVLPKLAHGLWSRVVSLGPPVGHLSVILLLQHGVELLHSLLLLQLPLLLL
jgi:hypothetical protein